MTSAVLYTLFPAAATVVGAAVALYRRPGDAAMRVIHHFTAGIVFAAAATEILPDLKQQSPVAVLLGGAAGVLLMLLVRRPGPQGERVEWEHTPRLVTDDMLMLRTAAIAGAGIVQLPAMMMRDDMLRGELVQLLPGWQPQGGVVHAVYPSRRGLLPAVRLLLDYLGEQFASIEEE